MKIVCDKCQTKYSIADEKVSGKVFKIRCKKCSHIIVVKGNEGAAETGPAAHEGAEASPRTMARAGDAPAAVTVGGGDKVWYLVVGGEQVGPFSHEEVQSRFASGEVDGETYAWREGFGDWLRLSTIEDFRDLGANGAVANGGETRRTDLGDMFGQHRGAAGDDEDGAAADIFGGGGHGGASRAVVAPAPSDDLFGAAPAAAQGGGGFDDARAHGGASFGAAEAAAADSKLTGQRNENSVLFSLSNLSAMATSGGASKASAPASTAAPAPESRPGYATARNEGSGLIDIRAMAAATLSSAGSSSGGSDASVDIPSFSAAPVFTPMVSAPVMMPSAQGGVPKWIYAVIGVGGLAILGIGGLVTALLLKKPEPVPQVALAPIAAPQPAGANAITGGANPAPGVAATPVAGAGGGAAAGAAVAASAAEAAKAGADPNKAAAAAADSAAHKGGKHVAAPAQASKPGKGAGPSPAAAAAPATGAPTSKADTPKAASSEEHKKPKKGGDSLDDLLNEATPGGGGGGGSKKAAKAEAAPPAEDANLPDQLERGDVLAGMKAVQSRVMGCYTQFHVPGVAMVNLTIGKSGKVSAATVGGALSGTPTGDCVSKAVRSASFKRFKGAPMTINYPFQLR